MMRALFLLLLFFSLFGADNCPDTLNKTGGTVYYQKNFSLDTDNNPSTPDIMYACYNTWYTAGGGYWGTQDTGGNQFGALICRPIDQFGNFYGTALTMRSTAPVGSQALQDAVLPLLPLDPLTWANSLPDGELTMPGCEDDPLDCWPFLPADPGSVISQFSHPSDMVTLEDALANGDITPAQFNGLVADGIGLDDLFGGLNDCNGDGTVLFGVFVEHSALTDEYRYSWRSSEDGGNTWREVGSQVIPGDIEQPGQVDIDGAGPFVPGVDDGSQDIEYPDDPTPTPSDPPPSDPDQNTDTDTVASLEDLTRVLDENFEVQHGQNEDIKAKLTDVVNWLQKVSGDIQAGSDDHKDRDNRRDELLERMRREDRLDLQGVKTRLDAVKGAIEGLDLDVTVNPGGGTVDSGLRAPSDLVDEGAAGTAGTALTDDVLPGLPDWQPVEQDFHLTMPIPWVDGTTKDFTLEPPSDGSTLGPVYDSMAYGVKTIITILIAWALAVAVVRALRQY